MASNGPQHECESSIPPRTRNKTGREELWAKDVNWIPDKFVASQYEVKLLEPLVNWKSPFEKIWLKSFLFRFARFGLKALYVSNSKVPLWSQF
jgi:hypothetical protein